MPIISDGTRDQLQGNARKICNDAGFKIVDLEKETPSANRSERYIQTLKKDYCIERRAMINNYIAKDSYFLKGNVTH